MNHRLDARYGPGMAGNGIAAVALIAKMTRLDFKLIKNNMF